MQVAFAKSHFVEGLIGLASKYALTEVADRPLR